MAFAAGALVGPYRILGKLGEGGMGEVYRAADPRLNREVALKVLPAAVTHDPVRIARFKREAQLLAALNHTNIGGIYGLEETDGATALVLELIEGVTLAERIKQGPLNVEEALPIAEQIALALAAAHEQGIVHRDLKPANIKIKPDGTVKVLDFGLAKSTPSGAESASLLASSAETITTPVPFQTVARSVDGAQDAYVTGAGDILGTAAYMSPEQASGKAADKRSDLWSFGVVLLESLTGRLVFSGETISHVLAAVLRADVDFSTLPAETPEPVRRLLKRCLEKDPKRRLDSAAVAVLELQDARHPASVAPPVVQKPRSIVLPVAVAAVTSAVLAGAAVWTSTRSDATNAGAAGASAAAIRFAITPPADSPFRPSIQAAARDFAVAPDGSFLVYRAGTEGRLMIRRFDRLEVTPIEGVTAAAMPFVSPDSKWIGFVQSDLTLRKVAASGGAPVTLTQLPVWPRGATWLDDAIIVGTNNANEGLLRVPAGGGEPTVLTVPDPSRGEEGHLLPFALPDGHSILFTIGANSPANAQVALFDLRAGTYSTLLRGARDAQYLSSGHLIYLTSLAMSAVRFDLATRAVVGAPVRVMDNVAAAPTSALNAATTAAGTLVFVSGNAVATDLRTLVWVDRQGAETPLPAPARPYQSARISPDGTRIAVSIRDQENDIWIWSIERQTLTRVTTNPDIDVDPVWTRDGRRIVFSSARGGAYNLYSREVDGADAADVRLTSSPNTQLPGSITPDSQFIIGHEVRPQSKSDVVRFGLVSGPAPGTASDTLIQTPFDEWSGEVSPDGRLLAYQSGESGAFEVYARPYPKTGDARWQISSSSGTYPAWTGDSRQLVYLDHANHLTVVPLQFDGTTLKTGAAVALTRIEDPPPAPWRPYDVTRDGKRFLVLKHVANQPAPAAASFVVVQGWLNELTRLAPAAK